MVNPRNKPQNRRKRGVVLNNSGIERFKEAKAHAEYLENRGNRYTLEALSERTGISVDTLSKVFSQDCRVDKQTLKCCFKAFDLELYDTDYHRPELETTSTRISTTNSGIENGCLKSGGAESHSPFLNSVPGGLLSLHSSAYVERAKSESTIYQALEQPGALIRIKGAYRFGKTSIMARINQEAKLRGFQPVAISFQLAEASILQDLDKLLKWFCANVSLELNIESNLETYWDSLFGSKLSSKVYFEQYLLANAQRPIVLLLDDVDRLFRYPEIADEFFGFLRTCYEEAKTSEIWQLVRIVMSQASEVYIPLNINKSPFNVGISIQLLPFTAEQIQVLASNYSLECSLSEATDLRQLLGGQPYLIHLAIHHSWSGETSIPQLLEAPFACGIFSSYLQSQSRRLQQTPILSKVLSQALSHQTCDDAAALCQLQGMGLVMLENNQPQPACKLFFDYLNRSEPSAQVHNESHFDHRVTLLQQDRRENAK